MMQVFWLELEIYFSDRMMNNKLFIIIFNLTDFYQLILIQILGLEFIMLSKVCIKKPAFI